MDFTIEYTSGGNHGHQLKDALGGLTIGRLYNLNYVHTPYKYLDYFGLGYNCEIVEKADRALKYKKIVRVEGPLWCGIDNYDELLNYFNKALPERDENTLVVLENALRIHPFQTIPWYQNGQIQQNVFAEIQEQTSKNFNELHHLKITDFKSPIKVAMHINRGNDYDKEKYPSHFSTPFAVRYMFDMDYYENILVHIEKAYGIGNVTFSIYTEAINSEAIVERFATRPNTEVNVGSNREEKNYDQIHGIFRAFVEADILVCSNSSFSVMCAYFRKNRKTIYHPHLQLRYLPEPNYIKTDDDGNIDIEGLKQEITEDIYDTASFEFVE